MICIIFPDGDQGHPILSSHSHKPIFSVIVMVKVGVGLNKTFSNIALKVTQPPLDPVLVPLKKNKIPMAGLASRHQIVMSKALVKAQPLDVI